MRRGHLDADAGLPAWYDGEAEADDVDTVVEQAVSHLSRKSGIADHDGHDRVLTGPECQASSFEALTHALGVGMQPVTQRAAVLDQVDGLERRVGNDRRQRVGEQVRPRAL